MRIQFLKILKKYLIIDYCKNYFHTFHLKCFNFKSQRYYKFIKISSFVNNVLPILVNSQEKNKL